LATGQGFEEMLQSYPEVIEGGEKKVGGVWSLVDPWCWKMYQQKKLFTIID